MGPVRNCSLIRSQAVVDPPDDDDDDDAADHNDYDDKDADDAREDEEQRKDTDSVNSHARKMPLPPPRNTKLDLPFEWKTDGM